MLIKIFKQILAPAMASKGVMHYWRGNYEKSFMLLEKANRWNPEITKFSVFEACLGLSLFHLGKHETAIPYLVSAQSFLAKISSHDPELASIEHEALKEINQILSRRNVL
jgi:hypothetical protein